MMMCPPYKPNPLPGKEKSGLSEIICILAFLIGILIFLLIGERFFGIKPNPTWIALLMGLSVSMIVFWVWGQIRHREDRNDD
jgi:Na+-driven multidrug efflux pump